MAAVPVQGPRDSSTPAAAKASEPVPIFLPAVAVGTKGGDTTLLEQTANKSSRFSIASALKPLGKGLAFGIGTIFTVVGSPSSLLMQAATILAREVGKIYFGGVGALAGLLVGTLVLHPVKGMQRGTAIGERIGGLVVGGVTALALLIPYTISTCLADGGVKALHLSGVSPRITNFCFNLATFLPQAVLRQIQEKESNQAKTLAFLKSLREGFDEVPPEHKASLITMCDTVIANLQSGRATSQIATSFKTISEGLKNPTDLMKVIEGKEAAESLIKAWSEDLSLRNTFQALLTAII